MNAADVQILFADLQPEIVARSRTTPPEALAASAGVLARVATLLGLPILFSVVPEGGRAPELIPELRSYATNGTVFPRVSASPFTDTATVAALGRSGRKTIAICGFATEVVSLHAALGAIAAGYTVQLPLDANGGMSDRTEAAAIRQIEAAGGTSTSVVTLATMLAPDFAESPGADVLEALQALRLA
jgi:hypothetical protein